MTDAKIGLSRCLEASDKRTEAIERHLKGQVEPILQKLCLGFVQDEAAGTYIPETLQVIYQNAIYLLYRILFLFYAEARGLLPIENPTYQPAGLAALVVTARQRQQEGIVDGDAFSLWKKLTRLCVVVDDGDEELGVTAYNGGLFSDTEKPYLKNHKIQDEYLAPARAVHAHAGIARVALDRGLIAEDDRPLAGIHHGSTALVVGGIKAKCFGRSARRDKRLDDPKRRPRLLTARFEHDGNFEGNGGNPERVHAR